MADHSILPPSSATVWGSPHGCTGSVLMSQMYPETTETPEAAEGTASHEVGMGLIMRATNPTVLNTLKIGMVASNGVIINDEMFECAEMYADDVATIMRRTGNFVPNVEQRINCPTIHQLSWGTPDCWFFDKATGHLWIWDYKFGFDVVSAFENWQIINYLAGIIPTLGVPDEHITVHVLVVQPRAYRSSGPVDEWMINGASLRPYFNQLEAKAHEALQSGAPFTSGPHCKHCTGRHACDASLRSGVQLYEVATQVMPLDLPPDALGVQLQIVKRAMEQLKLIESGMFEQVQSLVKSGKTVPGWMLESTYGRQKWTVPIPEVLALGTALGKNLQKDGAITPKQAIKLGIDANVINEYSITPSTGLKLVPDNGTKAKRMFNHD